MEGKSPLKKISKRCEVNWTIGDVQVEEEKKKEQLERGGSFAATLAVKVPQTTKPQMSRIDFCLLIQIVSIP